MIEKNPSLMILDEINEYIIPLTANELLCLEKSIEEEGCRDSLIVWKKNENEFVIIDGHNRYKICKKLNLPFNYEVRKFDDMDQVKLWMIQNQIGRRNLNEDQLSYYRGLKYLSLKKKKGGFENIKSKGNNKKSTSFLLSEEFRVSESTIKRDSQFAEGLNLVGRISPQVKMQILTGVIKTKKTDVQAFRRTNDLEKMVKALQSETFENPKKTISEVSIALTNENDEPLNALKEMIIKAIRRVIVNRDEDDLKKLKLLIVKLEDELFNKEKSAHSKTASL